MTLKFNDELIINGTEWTYPTFRFDIDTITPTGGTPPQPTSSKKVRLWATIREGNTSTGDAEGFITGQNDFSVQKGTLDNSRVRLFADNWEDIATIEFNYDNAPTAVAWTNITDDSYPTLTFTATDSKCTIDLTQIQDKSIIYNIYFTIDNGNFTLSNFRALDPNGKNIAGDFSKFDLYVPNGTVDYGFNAFDMRGYSNFVRNASTASGTVNNVYYKLIEGISSANKIKMHTAFTLNNNLTTSGTGKIRLVALKGNSSNTYSILYLQANADTNSLQFGAEPTDTSGDTLTNVITNFNNRTGHTFTADLAWDAGNITCTVVDNTAEETFTQTLAFPQLHLSIADGFAIGTQCSVDYGSITMDLHNTYFEKDDVLVWNPITKVTNSSIDSKGIIDGSYKAVLTDGNDITNGILDLSNSNSNYSYFKSIMSIGNLFKRVNNKNSLWGNNNSLVIRFKLPSSFISNSKRFWSFGNASTNAISCDVSVSSGSTMFTISGLSSSNISVSVNLTTETMYEYVFRNYDSKLYALLYNVETGEILSRTSITIASASSDVLCGLVLGNMTAIANLQLLVDLNHTYTTKQGIINWTSSKLAIK